MSTFLADLKMGLRLVRKSPGASLVAIVALGLGIGANTAIFSIANALLIHPLPYAQLGRLVDIGETAPRSPNQYSGVSNFDFEAWSRQARSFSGLAAYQYQSMNLSAAGTPAIITGAQVSANFFQLLPSPVLRGRGFTSDDAQPGHRVVILSQALWQHQFGSDPGVLGRAVELDQQAYTVIGVMSAQAVMPQHPEFWTPLALTPAERDDHTGHHLDVVAELKPGVSLAQAGSEMRSISQRIATAYPATDSDWGVMMQSLARRTTGDETASYVSLLMGAVGFLLLIACANVANLQFARTLARNHELAIRSALGARRGRIARQLLTESIILGLGGAVVGLVFAWFSIRLVLAYMPADVAVYIGGWDRIRLDGTALLFTLAIAIAAGVIAGLAPAWHASRPDLNASLKDGGRGATSSARRRLRAALVVVQVALALTLLVGSGLLVRGFETQLAVGDSYAPATLLTASVNLPSTPAYQSDATRRAFFAPALQRLSALPGVAATGLSSALPLGTDGSAAQAFTIEGRPALDAAQLRHAAAPVVSPNFFDLMHIPVIAGRAFTTSDGAGAPAVVVVSRALARRDWPGQSPLGEHIKLGADAATSPWLTVVGVAADVQWDWSDPNLEPTFYRPAAQAPPFWAYFLLRGSGTGDVVGLAPSVRRAVAGVNPALPLFQVKSLAEFLHESMLGLAYVAVMMAVAGLLALALAAIGIYGVMAWQVGERRHEFGIRRALGASPASIVALVLRRGLVLLAAGFLLGLPLAWALARAMAFLIPGNSGSPATYAEISVLLAAVALLACLIPARQATRADPWRALRQQ